MAMSLARFIEMIREDIKGIDMSGIDVEVRVKYGTDEAIQQLQVAGNPVVKMTVLKAPGGRTKVFSYMTTSELLDEDLDDGSYS